MRILALIIVLVITACGSNESETKEVPKNALCKTLKDGSVQRYEIAPEETALREVMAGMGFVPCE
jgi:ABC-type Fe3+-hydroxamate transport system substrate-binding protein